VSWALRSLGGRSARSHEAVLKLACTLAGSKRATERWVGKDVLRDITRPLIAMRVAEREQKRTTAKMK